MGHNSLVRLTDVRGGQPAGAPLRIILFSGGRGAGVLTRELVAHPSISLTIAINGYDDGASTGEVRRFLRDSLGPSDFRKNAARLATDLRSCSPALIELLDLRLPVGASEEDARTVFTAIAGAEVAASDEVRSLTERLDPIARSRVAEAIGRFADVLRETGRP